MIRRLVSIEFWTDDKVVDEFSPEDKYFMLYLLTNPHTTQLGIYKLNVKYAAFETGYSEETVRSLLERFEKHHGVIYYSKSTGEVAIKNYLIHSIIKGGKPVADLLWKEINDVNNKELIDKVFDHIKNSDKINKTVRNIINSYYNYINNNIIHNENENEIHNEIHNENDKSYPLSCNDSSDDSLCTPKTTPKKQSKSNNKSPKKKKYGEYQNVLLTDDEYNKLCFKYGETTIAKAIKYLDEYIEEDDKRKKDYKSKSHNLVIRRWVVDAVNDQQKKKTGKSKNQFNNYQSSTTKEVAEEFENLFMQETNK